MLLSAGLQKGQQRTLHFTEWSPQQSYLPEKYNLLGLNTQMETSSSGPDLSPGPETTKPFLLQAESSLEVGWESTGQRLGC